MYPQDPSKRFGASLGALSSGRTGIMVMGTTNLQLATVIAVRYSAARRQFGPEGASGRENSVLEYQMQQCRLFPYLAAAYVHHALSMSFFQVRLNEMKRDSICFIPPPVAKKCSCLFAYIG